MQVAVIIPAYNASATLAETIASVTAQTHRPLDIVIVDDGSTDNTGEIAEAFRKRDSRIRLISTPNQGVARARNTGIAATTADFVAPIDADDLWHPEKISRQLSTMQAAGADTGFVYAPHRVVDRHGRVTYDARTLQIEGWAYMRHLVVNFVSCGSSLLIRRKALDSAGGYDPRLRAQGKQGTEDYLLQLMIARQWRVAMVPEYLVGYRRTAEGMSSDSVRMARSRIASLEIVAKRFPDTPAWLLEQAIARAETTIFMRCLRRGRLAEAMPALRTAAMSAPATALAEALFITRRVIVDRTRRALRRLLGRTGPARRFDALPPEIGHGPAAGLWLRHQLCAAAALEGPPRHAGALAETALP